MIINFKIFENTEEYEDFNLKQYSCWTINGQIPDILKVLEKIKETAEFSSSNYELDFVQMSVRLFGEPHKYWISGIILFFGRGFSYSLIKDEKEKERILNAIKRSDTYNFEGEIKLIDDKLYLDTLELDMMKYNL